jgi:Fe-S cluster biogenesis protein NfuA
MFVSHLREMQGKVSMPAPSNVQSQLQSIEALLQRIEKANDPAMSAMAKELVQRLMEFHGAGIERMLELIHQNAAAENSGAEHAGAENGAIDTLGRDPLVSSLLLLYGLHPDALETRVQHALEKTRPYLTSHGGSVNLVSVDGAGAVTVRLEGTSHGCSSTSAGMKRTVEEAIYESAPDVTAIIVEGAIEELSPAAGFVPLSVLSGNGGNGHDLQTKRNEAHQPLSEAARSAM